MRWALLLILLVECAFATNLTVCASGCDYTTIDAAIAAIGTAAGNHVITITSGETVTMTGIITMPKLPGGSSLTIKSSRAFLLPDGYRPAVGDSRLATIAFTDVSYAFTYGTDPTFTPAAWSVSATGNDVTFGANCSVGNPCELRDTAGTVRTYTAPPCVVSLLGVSVSEAGTSGAQGTGLRVGIATDGKCQVAHKSTIAETTQFTCSNCSDYPVMANYGFPIGSVPLGNIAYNTSGNVTSAVYRPNWLSGPVVNDSTIPGVFNGTQAASYSGPANGVHDITWEGIDFYKNTTVEGYSSALHYKGAGYEYQYVPHNIRFSKCLFRAQKAQYGHYRWLSLQQCDRCSVEDTRFLNTQTRAEGQAILQTASLGPLRVKNIEIDGATEGILIGGGSQLIAGRPEVSIERSYFRWRWELWPKAKLIRQADTSVLALTGLDGSTRCNAGTCQVAYENTWHTKAQDSTLTVTAGTAAKVFVAVASDGTLKAYHNGNVTCAGDFTCVSGTTARSSFPDDAVLWEWSATAGVWGSTTDWHSYWAASGSASYSWIQPKNFVEFKTGRNVLMQGNVMRYYYAASQTQPCCVGIRNQNGQDVTVGLDGFTFTRSKMSTAHSGFSLFTRDGFGRNTFGRKLQISHSIFTDLTKASYGNSTSGGYSITISQLSDSLTAADPLVINHVTMDIDKVGIRTGACSAAYALNVLFVFNSFFGWNPATYGGMAGDGTGAWNALRSDDSTCSQVGFGLIHGNSRYEGNLNIGTGTISNTNWGTSWADLASENFYNNVRLSSATLSDHFTSISTPMTVSDNLRIPVTSVYSVHNASYAGPATTDGMDAGADVDWVETLTDGVIEGYPTWGERQGIRVVGKTLYISGLDTYTVQVSAHQRMKTADLEINTSTPTTSVGGQKTYSLATAGDGFRWIRVTGAASGVWKEKVMLR